MSENYAITPEALAQMCYPHLKEEIEAYQASGITGIYLIQCTSHNLTTIKELIPESIDLFQALDTSTEGDITLKEVKKLTVATTTEKELAPTIQKYITHTTHAVPPAPEKLSALLAQFFPGSNEETYQYLAQSAPTPLAAAQAARHFHILNQHMKKEFTLQDATTYLQQNYNLTRRQELPTQLEHLINIIQPQPGQEYSTPQIKNTMKEELGGQYNEKTLYAQLYSLEKKGLAEKRKRGRTQYWQFFIH